MANLLLADLFDKPFYAITADSRQVDVGSLFLAYPGDNADGRDYIAQAISNGAAAVLYEEANFSWDERWDKNAKVPHVALNHLRHQVGYLADEFYDHPSQKLWMIGVTGTNGKTSVSQWIAQAFNAIKRKSAVIGTIGNGFIDELTAAINTTPDSILLQEMLADYLAQDAEVVAMEVSSHGLDQGRVNGVHFNVAVLTNLTHDHLDYHGDMTAYAAAKKKLFLFDSLSAAIINADDSFGVELATELKASGKNVITYGIHHGDVRAKELQLNASHITMLVTTPMGDASVSAPVIGRFNAYNLLAVLATLLASQVSLADAVQAMSQIKAVAGRMQTLGGNTLPLVVVDYAHTPDALEKVLTTLKEQLAAQPVPGKLICVFGCGGNRDATKRNVMGHVAIQIADAMIVTSDNPRSEDPEKIIKQIVQGITQPYMVESNRGSAIAIGVLSAKAGDVVLIAGKGHEDYQEIKAVKHHFSDVEQATLALKMYEENFV